MGWFMKYYLVPDWALHSAPNSAPYSKIWKVTVLVSSLRTTDHAINFTQDTLHPFFIKKKCAFHCRTFEMSTFYNVYTSFLTVWGVQNLKSKSVPTY